MKNWLESFALITLPSHLLHHSPAVFKAAKEEQGQAYLHALGREYALKHGHQEPAFKCMGIDFTNRYPGFEAVFIQVWPCLYLSQPPVYLAAIRQTDCPGCRLFRMHYLEDKQLSLSEIELYNQACTPLNLPTYQEATAIIFSYTLGTPCFQHDVLEQAWEVSSLYPEHTMVIR